MSESALCRTCARPADRLQPLFTHPEKYKRYALALKLATGLQIEMNDGLPQYICTECSQELNRVLKFRTNSQKAQTRLLELGYRKSIINNQPTCTTMKKELVVQEKSLDSDDSLDERDYDEDEFDTFGKTGTLGSIGNNKKNFSNSERMKLDDSQSLSQLRLDRYLDTSAPLYTCKECKKCYKSKGSLVAHTAIHTGLQYMCDLCGKVLSGRHSLLLHQQSIHGAARDSSLRCPHCEYHAIDNRHLTVHIRTHTGERPYICDACGVGFTDRELLVQHLSVHITERNVQCKECPAKFKSRHDLNAHRYGSHKPRRWNYQCTYCPKTYVKSNTCRTHMRKSHGIPNDQQEKHIRVPNTLKQDMEHL